MKPLVFILGLHRSGTTLLYEMLAASECFNIVTARHVVDFDRLGNGRTVPERSRGELQSWFDREGLADRQVDAVRLGPDTPEEYGFVLDNLGAGRRITPRNVHVFERVCTTIGSDFDQDRPLLLKNPWDFGNARVIKKLMPESKIVYIHRNPFHVLGSLLRMVVAAMERPHPYMAALSAAYSEFTQSEYPWRLAQRFVTKDSDLLARLLVHLVAHSAKSYLRDVAPPGGDDRIDINYERLCHHPNAVIAAILDHVGAKSERTDYRELIGSGASRSEPAIARQSALIRKMFAKYAREVGYDLEALENKAQALSGGKSTRSLK